MGKQFGKFFVSVFILLFCSVAWAGLPPFYADSVFSWDGDGTETYYAYETDGDPITGTLESGTDVGAYGEQGSVGIRMNAANEGYTWDNDTVHYVDGTDGHAQTIYIRFMISDPVDGTTTLFQATNGNSAGIKIEIDSDSDLNVTWDYGASTQVHNSILGNVVPLLWYTFGVTYDTTVGILTARVFNGPWNTDSGTDSLIDWSSFGSGGEITLGTTPSFSMDDYDGDSTYYVAIDRVAVVNGYKAELPEGWPGPVNFDSLGINLEESFEGPVRLLPYAVLIPQYIRYNKISTGFTVYDSDTYDWVALHIIMVEEGGVCDGNDHSCGEGIDVAYNGGTYSLEIQTDADGYPSGTKVAGSNTVPYGGGCSAALHWPDEARICDYAGSLTAIASFERIDGFNAALTADQKYHLVIWNTLSGDDEDENWVSWNFGFRSSTGSRYDQPPYVVGSKSQWNVARQPEAGGSFTDLPEYNFMGAIGSATHVISNGYYNAADNPDEYHIDADDEAHQQISPYRDITVDRVYVLVADIGHTGSLYIQLQNNAGSITYATATIAASEIPDHSGGCTTTHCSSSSVDCYHLIEKSLSEPVELNAYGYYRIRLTAIDSGSFLIEGKKHGGATSQPAGVDYFIGGYGAIMDSDSWLGTYQRRGNISIGGTPEYPAWNFDIPVFLGIEVDGDSSPPTPDPMTFAIAPDDLSTTSIDMTATIALDDTPPIEYYFTLNNTNCASNAGTGGTDSDWQESTGYTDSGLQTNKCYGYTVTARDSETPPNTGTASSIASAYTTAATPGTPTLDSQTVSTLNLTNDANGNPATNPATKFAIQVVTTTPTDNDWLNKWVDSSGDPQSSEQWVTDAQADAIVLRGLNESTLYGVKVKARNEDSDETSLSSEGQGTTGTPGIDTFIGNTTDDFIFRSSGHAEVTITWVDATYANGVTGTIYFPDKLFGYLFYYAVTDPGATAPTSDYDIYLTKANGEDVFDGKLIDRSASDTEAAWSTGYHVVDGDLTFTLSNNSINNATGTVTIYLIKPFDIPCIFFCPNHE